MYMTETYEHMSMYNYVIKFDEKQSFFQMNYVEVRTSSNWKIFVQNYCIHNLYSIPMKHKEKLESTHIHMHTHTLSH